MTIEALLIWLIIGAVAGYLAGVIVTGYGFGVVGNIVVGIVGAFLAAWLFPRLGFYASGDILGQVVAATIGAIVLLVLIGLIRRA
jgi:uncharacterized membrane protein YeaQ/YmgE (transglycosylase-associated protein family)